MNQKDYYQILNVPITATSDEIKTAYYDLVIKFHPDRNPNDPYANENFQKIQEAYETLSNPIDRKKYDLEKDKREAYYAHQRNSSYQESNSRQDNNFYEQDNFHRENNSYKRNKRNSWSSKEEFTKYKKNKTSTPKKLSKKVSMQLWGLAIFLFLVGLFFLKK